VKTTEHFERALQQRPYIKRQWCERIATQRAFAQKMPSGRTRFWGWVEELGHYIRVVVLADGETLHTAMIDSNFKGGTR
jgi:hypothetical protein